MVEGRLKDDLVLLLALLQSGERASWLPEAQIRTSTHDLVLHQLKLIPAIRRSTDTRRRDKKVSSERYSHGPLVAASLEDLAILMQAAATRL